MAAAVTESSKVASGRSATRRSMRSWKRLGLYCESDRLDALSMSRLWTSSCIRFAAGCSCLEPRLGLVGSHSTGRATHCKTNKTQPVPVGSAHRPQESIHPARGVSRQRQQMRERGWTTECAPGASKRPPLREPPDRLRMSGLGLFRPCRFRTVLNYVVLRFNVILSCHISNHHSTHQRPGSRHRRDLLIIWRHSLCSSLPLAFTRPTIVSARDIGRPPAFIASAPALLIQCCQSHPCDLREVLDKAHCRLL